MEGFELPGGLKPQYRGAPPPLPPGTTEAEIRRRFEEWQKAQKAQRRAYPSEREMRLEREAQYRATVAKREAERAWKVRKKMEREPNAWRAALRALRRMPPDFTARTGTSAATFAFGAYTGAKGELSYDEWLAELGEVLKRRREAKERRAARQAARGAAQPPPGP